MTICVGYLGPSGSYSEAVCKDLYPPENYPSWNFKKFPDLLALMDAINKKQISLAVIPCQNSRSGLLKDQNGHEFLSWLIHSRKNLNIINEKFWPLNFILMGNPGCSLETIQTIHLNLFSEEQCKEYFTLHSDWKIEKHTSSSAAARTVKESGAINHAAIASMDSAKEYNLTILEKISFPEGDEPIMHFLVMGYPEIFQMIDPPREPLITTFAIEMSSLDIFKHALLEKEYEISMLRKSAEIPGMYYLDLHGAWPQNKLQNLLFKNIKLKCLGIYPASPDRALYQNRFFIV